ncbi:MGH1-like glycoside hydrolase domain-containing protein [Mucilaginibacter sp.]|uniref:alpha-L-rhamnosidase-related protein n=1 Tax=Mucilaginibacter sp. TaxID=1882438 RepID=UPI0028450E27|nr:glycogen debranching protein [Mucilaginibacter sp.]MDR3697836.1 glycogen debranching protein [Mucilaginibacter sp.]
MKTPLRIFGGLLLLSTSAIAQNNKPVYTSKAYTIYPDRVVQGKYIAKAISSTSLTSNYRSPANLFKSPVIEFKFSINGKDNELTPGVNHHFTCLAQGNETPVIEFGEPDKVQKLVPATTFLKPSTQIKIRLNMNPVLSAFKQRGFYTCVNGDKIYKNDFKGVFVAGNTAPMIWDFNNLVNHPDLQLKDPDGDGIYETTLVLNKPEDENKIASSWTMTRDASAFPQYHSGYKISDAVYNLALEEMQKAVEPDSTFRTGKEWGGVWTRDISYSIILSMAVLQPKVAVYSLMRKVKNDRIIQDTGTGGAYPCSSDRMIWGVAAYEVYKVTGDKDWLAKAYRIIKNSADDDALNVYDSKTGLVRGESSFLDWREETYPKWMQPADIYESECLGTNVVHYQVNKVLSQMAALLKDPAAAALYRQRAATIKKGIQAHLWIPEKGYYGQYLYGRNYKTLSPRAEGLGEALSVLFDAAGPNAQSVISNTPVNEFGIPCIYPQIPGILPYHNNAIWPFVESYWAMASAKAGDEISLMRAIGAVYRPAAMFLTNKENMVATDGDYAGTQINSSNMLWSLSGNIALVYKVLFGIHYNESSLQFQPFVPEALAGERSLENYKYRGAVLNISMQGFGNLMKSISLDGKALPGATIPAGLTGVHTIKIILADNVVAGKSNLQPGYTAPETPIATYQNGTLSWDKIPGAVSYRILKNGKLLALVKAHTYKVPANGYAEYQVASVDAKGVSSFNSEPVQVIPANVVSVTEAETVADKSDLPYQGFSGSGFVEISKTQNTSINIPLNITQTGVYAIDFKYANGNGPINTENKCAIRALDADGHFAGTVVFPQRGKGVWSDWGFSNSVQLHLSKGKHILSLQFKPANENMNGDINQAMVDYLRVVRLN